MHVAVPISTERFEEIDGRLRQRGVSYQRIGNSVYLKDPNGMSMELMVE